MKRKLSLVFLLGAVLLGPAALADGDFYPGGPLGIRITSLPFTISNPGSYYLGSNLSYSGGHGITIASDHVTLDLMGFTLTGPGSTYYAISMTGRQNVEIRNGTLSGWQIGIREGYSTGTGHRVINIRAEGNETGVFLGGSGHLIKGCQASGGATSVRGFYIDSKGIISGCRTNNFASVGIEIDDYGTITNNVVIGPGSVGSYGGIYAGSSSLVMGNEVSDAVKGIYCQDAASVIGNTVTANAGQTGIRVSTTQPALLDQNTVRGDGTHYQGITPGVTVTRNNAG